MATLILTAVFINLFADGTAVSGQSGAGRSEVYAYPGDVRTYAGGRRRSITSAGELGSYGVTLTNVSRATVETLRTWAGSLVQVRDNKGRRLFGVFHKLEVAEYPAGDPSWNVTLTLDVVTATEGV